MTLPHRTHLLTTIAAAVLIFPASYSFAAGPATASIGGQVIDASGEAVPGAEIQVRNEATGLRRRALSNRQGYFTVPELPLTGRYVMRIAKAGFAPQNVSALQLHAGVAASVNVILKPAGQKSVVTVSGTARGVRTDSPQLETSLNLETIDETPLLGRKITELPLLNSAVRPARNEGDLFLDEQLFVVDGAGRRQTSYYIDGTTANDAWGRQTIFTDVPLSAIQEFTVMTDSFDAQYGRTSGSVMNVVTKSGTNKLHGEGVVLYRPAGIQARDPVASTPTSDRLQQYSGAFSGPLVHDRTFFMVSGEYDHGDTASSITSPLAPGVFMGRYEQGLVFARADRQINGHNSVTASFNFDRMSDSNPQGAVGGLALPSTARTFYRRTYAARVGETAALRPAFLNEFHFEFLDGAPITEFQPAHPSTEFVYPGFATIGQSQSALLNNRQLQMEDFVSLIHGRNTVQFGGGAIRSSSGGNSQEFGGPITLGEFVVKPGVVTPVSQLTLNEIQSFTQGFGTETYNVKEWLLGAFVQDNLKAARHLTLNLGLRYDRQTFTDSTTDFSPRIGFAYDVLGGAKTVLHGGYGIYFSEVPANSAAAWLLGGPTGFFNFTVQPGQLGFPSSLAPLPAFPVGALLPPRNIGVRPGDAAYLSQFFNPGFLKGYPTKLLNPYSQVTDFGIERQLGDDWLLDVDYVHQLTVRILRDVDLDSPSLFLRTQPGQIRPASVADLTRPIVQAPNGFRQINAMINEGTANYDALQVNLRKRFGRNFAMLASYTWSHAIDDAEMDAPGGAPNDSNQLGSYERGNDQLDQRHRAVISGWWNLPQKFVLGGIATLGSGFPYNFTTGADNNGDGSLTDRPVINGAVVGRDGGRGKPLYDFSPFIERDFSLRERVRVTARAEAFNVLNHPNIVGFNGVYGNSTAGAPLPSFGQPLGGVSNVEPGREFQFSLRADF